MNSESWQGQQIAVIGGGAVGSATALRLVLDGHEVTLFEPDPKGKNASYGNAEHIGAASIVPWANPVYRKAALAARRDPLHPLIFRTTDMVHNWRWVLRYLRASTAERAASGAIVLKSVLDLCYETLETLLDAAGSRDLLACKGILHIFESASAYETARAGFDQRRTHGIPVQEMSPDELRALEPAFVSDAIALHRAVLLPTIGQVCDPGRMVASFRETMIKYGGVLCEERVAKITSNEKRTRLQTDSGEYGFDWCIIAAGIRSPELVRGLGVRIPLIAERGYHLQFDGSEAPGRPALLVDRRVVFSPMSRGLRMTTGAEFTSPDNPPAHDAMLRIFSSATGLLRKPPDIASGEQWMGSRPTTPDSLPVIEPILAACNILCAFGHGHSGLTMATPTAAILSALVRQQPSPVALQPFAPDRHG